MRRTVLFAMTLALLARPGWGNGEAVRYDPATGVILPAGATPAAVERERLEIEFRPNPDYPDSVGTVKVRAQYWLHNPTDKPLRLEIGFPAPGGALQLVEPPVRMDGQLGEWRLLSYEDLFKPSQPSLIRAMQRWADRHPEAVQLAVQMRQSVELPPDERHARRERLWQQLRAELIKAGVSAPARNSYECLYPSHQAARVYTKGVWNLRRALIATGQRHLLPEGRWHVDETVLEPATGRQMWLRESGGYGRPVSMLTFPLNLKPNGRHRLEVTYRQSPSQREEAGGAYDFAYILRTARGWASFGPIETTVKAPAGLLFRSLPALRYIGMSHGLKVYRGVISQPQRNLQVVLAHASMLRPRLKVNGRVRYERLDLLVHGQPTAPLSALGEAGLRLDDKRWVEGEVVLRRGTTVLRAKPGEKRMFVNERPGTLDTPIVVRNGTSCLPLAAVKALWPDYDLALTYHAPSHTVLFSAKPKPQPPS